MKAAVTIEQRHINATSVGRLSHQVPVTGTLQQRMFRKVREHGIILNLYQCNKVGKFLPIRRTREDFLTYAVLFGPIALDCPFVRAVGQKLCVLLSYVVAGVEQVFAVQLHKRKKGGQQ